jgi:hypothetical protein
MCEPIGSSPLQSCLRCVMIRVILIDGASPDGQPQDQNLAEPACVNGKEPEQQAVSEKEQQNETNTVETVKTAKEQ